MLAFLRKWLIRTLAFAFVLLAFFSAVSGVIHVYQKNNAYTFSINYARAVEHYAQSNYPAAVSYAAVALRAAYNLQHTRDPEVAEQPFLLDPGDGNIAVLPKDFNAWQTENLYASSLLRQGEATEPTTIAVSGIFGIAPYGYSLPQGFVQFVIGGYPVIFVLGFLLFSAYFFVFRFDSPMRRRLRNWLLRRQEQAETRTSLALLSLKMAFLAGGMVTLAALRPFIVFAFYGFGWLPLSVAALLTVAFIGYRVYRGHSLRKVARRVATAGLLLLPFALALGTFLLYGDKDPACEKVQKDPRLRLILSPCERDLEIWHKTIAPYPDMPAQIPHRGPRSIFASSDRSAIYCGFGGLDHPWPSSFVKIDRATGDAKHVLWLYSPFRGVCPFGSGKCVISSYQSKRLFVIDDIDDRIESEILFHHYKPSQLTSDPSTGDIYAPASFAPFHDQFNPYIIKQPLQATQRFARAADTFAAPETLAAFVRAVTMPQAWHNAERLQAQGWETFGESRPHDTVDVLERFKAQLQSFGKHNVTLRFRPATGDVRLFDFGMGYWGNIATAVYSPEFHKLYIGNGSPRPAILIGEGPDLKVVTKPLGLWRTLQSGGMGSAAVFDPDRKELYVSMLFGGSIYVFDAETFEFKRSIWVEVGVRDLQIDRQRRLLYAASYLKGDLHVFDLDERRFVDKIFVGTKIRELEFVEELDVLLIASNAGFLELTPRFD